ncbi:MAG: efflux RND transporter periplasmic adaptor subunit [Planctomycetota bacterium]|nr:efflux RND transporter periplasmic adaptor subunit [Planctomycetota bacterium]
MSTEDPPLTKRRRKSNMGWLVTLLVLAGLGFGGHRYQDDLRRLYQHFSQSKEKAPRTVRLVHQVSRGNLTVTVRERGSIMADNQISVESEVTGQARIIYLIPEGHKVEKGELLVELDSSSLLADLTQQEITVKIAEADLTEARENVAIQKQQNQTETEAAQLKIELAEAELLKYEEGDFPQSQRNAKSDITIAEEELKRAKDRAKWTAKLEGEGFVTRTELEADELSVKKAQLAMDKAQQALHILEVYGQPMTLKEKKSKVTEAKSELLRVLQKGRANLLQKEALLIAKQATLKLQKDKETSYRDQMSKCKIYAPAPGLVVYYKSNSRYNSSPPVEEGAMVRERQMLITLPDMSVMRMDVKVHESAIDMVRSGQKAKVSVDAISGQVFHGTVRQVAPLPDSQVSWLNPDLKVYLTQVVIDEDLAGMRPGLSAMAEIIVAEKKDVIRVPVQAVGLYQGLECCYVLDRDVVQLRAVEVGLANETFVHVEGLEEGEQVLLSPPDRIDDLVKVGFEEIKAKKAATLATAKARRKARIIQESKPDSPSETSSEPAGKESDPTKKKRDFGDKKADTKDKPTRNGGPS